MKFLLTGFISIWCLVTSAQYSERITISDADSIESQRTALTEAVFGDEPIPQFQLSSEVNKYVSVFSKVYAGGNLKNLEMGIVNLKHGFKSRVCMFHPVKSNGLDITIIYHTGHGFNMLQEDLYVNFNSGGDTYVKVIDYFLSKGFDVVGLDMPLLGLNIGSVTIQDSSQNLSIYGHNDIFNLPDPFYYFLAPVQSTVNYLEQQNPNTRFVMLGLSGGGWTTTLYSAIDSRIKLSFPVAGTIPMDMRIAQRDSGDLEQNSPALYDRFNYSTIYFLGSAGEGRMQYQVLNKYDHCCFAFDGRKYWVDSVKNALKRVNDPGQYEFYFDTFATYHRISSVAVDTIHQNILRHLAQQRFQPMHLVSSRASNTICDNDSLLLTVPGDNNIGYEWFRNGQPADDQQNGNTVRSDEEMAYTARRDGNYYARVTNISGATAYTDTITVVQNKMFQKPIITFNKEMIVSSYSSALHRWFRDDKLISGESGSKLVTKVPGRYRVLVTEGNCVSDLSDPLDVGVSVFPNPATNILNVRTEVQVGAISYSVFNFLGKAVASGKFSGETKIMLPPGLGTGIFYLKLSGINKWEQVVKFWVK